MPTTVTFRATASKPGAKLRLLVDADGSGDFDAAENVSMFPSGGAFERDVQIAMVPPSDTPFVLKVDAPSGTAVTLVATDAGGRSLYATAAPVVVSALGKNWIAG